MTAPRMPISVAFLLSQLGQITADKFAARIAELDLLPPQAGILRAIWTEPGRSQQALSQQLGLLPSRVVAFVDDLEKRGLVVRRKNERDRRLYALSLTEAGEHLMGELARVGMALESDMTAGITGPQRETLLELLALLAEHQDLTPGVHPGFKTIGREQDGATASG